MRSQSVSTDVGRAYTLHNYRKMINGRILPRLGHIRLDKLRPEDVDGLYEAMRADGLSAATMLQAHRILSRALKVAMHRGRVTRSVCTLVDAPQLKHREVEPLSLAEARRVLDAAAGLRNRGRWTVALALGLRQGEALGLQWRDIDLEQATLRVRQALQRQPGAGLVFVAPKSRAGLRTISLPPQVVATLRRHWTAQQLDRAVALGLWQEHDLVFSQANGKPIEPRYDHTLWKRLLRRAGVREVRLHDARHTAASLLLLQGVPARVVMEILGHSQVGLTLNTYSHVAPELARDAAERMGAALWDDDSTVASDS